MNFSPQKLSENFILNKLKLIKEGSLNLANHDDEKFVFGNLEKQIKASIKINTPKFYLNILKGGSTGLAESYVKDEFSTPDLTSLIELTAKNIDLTYRFSGVLNVRFLKNLFRNFF
jgi:cyclopropane-fatty-acyl-phospholipid synthase